jgi:hypothetical protein
MSYYSVLHFILLDGHVFLPLYYLVSLLGMAYGVLIPGFCLSLAALPRSIPHSLFALHLYILFLFDLSQHSDQAIQRGTRRLACSHASQVQPCMHPVTMLLTFSYWS